MPLLIWHYKHLLPPFSFLTPCPDSSLFTVTTSHQLDGVSKKPSPAANTVLAIPIARECTVPFSFFSLNLMLFTSLRHHNKTGLTNRDVDNNNNVIITILFLCLFTCFRKHNNTGHTNRKYKYYYAIFLS